MRIGLVLGAGGSVGVAYHGAVIAALEEATGWDPRSAEVIVGTSAGSITGAMLRAGLPASDLARISEDQPLSEHGRYLAEHGRPHRPRPKASHALNFRPFADPSGVLHAVSNFARHSPIALVAAVLPAGGIPTEPISEGINAVFDGEWPDEALWLCAMDLRRGRRVVFGKPGAPPAAVGSAVAASSAIPAYFRPVTINGRRYVDGGLHSMCNLDLMGDLELDLVIVSSPLSQASPRPVPSPYSLLRQAMRAQLHTEMRALRRRGVAVVAVEPNRHVAATMGLNPMDARKRGPVSRSTRAAVHTWLSQWNEGRWLAGILSSAARSAPRADPSAPVRLHRPSA